MAIRNGFGALTRFGATWIERNARDPPGLLTDKPRVIVLGTGGAPRWEGGMTRSVQISVASDRTDGLVAELRETDGVFGLRVHRSAAVVPPGDVIEVDATEPALHELLRRLAREGYGSDPSSSMATTRALSYVSSSWVDRIARDSTEATWEEMEMLVGRESNMTALRLLVMAMSGAIATVGVATNALHLVVGAMLIAPGFEPILRGALGLVSRMPARRGLTDVARGYGALAVAAALTALLLRGIGVDPMVTQPTYLPQEVLLSYWTSITPAGVMVSLAAAFGGAILVVTHRSVLTAGAMVALALVPSAAIAAAALALGDPAIALRAAGRWALDVAAVAIVGALVFEWRQRRVHRRSSLL